METYTLDANKEMISDQERLNNLREKIRNDWKSRGQIRITSGAFGDMENCAGLVEEITKPKEGGTFTKYYGCSIPFKGNPDLDVTREIGLAKSMISTIPREIIMRSFLLSSSIILMLLFAKKRFYHYLWVYSGVLREHSFISATIPYKERNEFTKELQRSLELSLIKNGYPQFSEEASDNYFDQRYHYTKGDLGKVIMNFAEFVYFFLETDVAYRFPAQDVLFTLKKNGLLKEVRRIFDLIIERTTLEGNEFQVRKWKYLKRMFLVVLIFTPKLRHVLKDFFLELDLSKVGLDDDDWYYCLQRRCYNYGGISLELRLKEKARIDKEKGHIILEFTKKNV